MNETDLIKQLQKLIDNIDLNETSIKKKVEAEVVRYKKFHKSLLGEGSDMAVNDIDVKTYVKFLLKDGTLKEKRDILTHLQTKVILANKIVYLD